MYRTQVTPRHTQVLCANRATAPAWLAHDACHGCTSLPANQLLHGAAFMPGFKRRCQTSHYVSCFTIRFLPNLTLRNQKISSAICFDSLVGFNLGLLLFLHSEGTDKQLYRPNEHGVWAKGRGGIWNRPAGPGARLIGDRGGIFTFLNSPQRRHGLPVLQSIPVFLSFYLHFLLAFLHSRSHLSSAAVLLT